MPVPDYLVDQEESYIVSRGYSFRDFSADQVLQQLELDRLMQRVNSEDPRYSNLRDMEMHRFGYKKVKSTSISGGYVWIKKEAKNACL